MLSAQQIRDDADYFGNLVRDQRIAGLVVGLPIHCDGGESQTSMKCREFARWLAGQTGIPVRLFDERFTTSDADQRIAAGGFSRQQRKARIDAVAAAVLLESFLESCRYSGKIVGENIASKPIGGDSLD